MVKVNLVMVNNTSNKLLENIKCISLLLIAFAVGCGSGEVLGIASVLSLIACIFDKERFINFKNDYFNKTVLLIIFNIFVLLVLAFLESNNTGVKYALRIFEKITSFLLIYILLGKVRYFLPISVLGLSFGLLYNNVLVVNDWLQALTVKNDNIRVRSLFGDPNKTGSIMELLLPFYMYFCYRFKTNIKLMLLSLLSIVGIVFCLYAAGSRGAYMAVITETIAFAALVFFRKSGIEIKIKHALIVFIVSVFSMFLFADLYPRTYDGERILLWTAAWQMFCDHPLIGIGVSQFSEHYLADYISPLAKEPNLPHPHNLFLYLLSTVGIIGFISHFVFYAWQVLICLRNGKQNYIKTNECVWLPDIFIVAIIGMLTHNCVDVLSTMRDYMLLYMFLWGICCLEMSDNKKDG